MELVPDDELRRLGLANREATCAVRPPPHERVVVPDEAALRQTYEALEQMGERGFLSTIAGYLAHALYAEGEDEEAEQFSQLSKEAAASDDVVSQVLWRTARAKILTRRGELARAEELARQAVELANSSELLNTQADALFDLAQVLAAKRTHPRGTCLPNRISAALRTKGQPCRAAAREAEERMAAPKRARRARMYLHANAKEMTLPGPLSLNHAVLRLDEGRRSRHGALHCRQSL